MTAVDKPPATAAGPVVPASAVEKAVDAFHDHRERLVGYPSVEGTIRAALTAAAPDLIAANTDDTKADALEEAVATAIESLARDIYNADTDPAFPSRQSFYNEGVNPWLMEQARRVRADGLCHCGRTLRYGYDGDPSHQRGMCHACDAVRCDAFPDECPYRAAALRSDTTHKEAEHDDATNR